MLEALNGRGRRPAQSLHIHSRSGRRQVPAKLARRRERSWLRHNQPTSCVRSTWIALRTTTSASWIARTARVTSASLAVSMGVESEGDIHIHVLDSAGTLWRLGRCAAMPPSCSRHPPNTYSTCHKAGKRWRVGMSRSASILPCSLSAASGASAAGMPPRAGDARRRIALQTVDAIA